MKNYKSLSLKVSLAGLLFGFDTMVISGADLSLQELWKTSDLFHGSVVMSMALWGTLIGAIGGGLPTNRLGRKKTLIVIGALYLISAIGSALAIDPYSFAFFRFLGGLGVGVSTIAAPAYIAEVSPAEHRGKMVGLYQFSIVFGILLAVASNYSILQWMGPSWRIMLGIEAIPAIVFLLFMLTIPESIQWLNLKDRILEKKKRSTIKPLSSSYRKLFYLAFWIAFFNQFSGINAVLYYAPRIFEAAGLSNSSAFLSTVGIGAVNLIFTLLGIYLIDRIGRRQLMIWGSLGYIFSLGILSIAFHYQLSSNLIVGLLFSFIAAHAIGQGAVIWVFLAEIFPTQIRSIGQSFGSSVHWALAAIIPSTIPFLFGSIGVSLVFALFAVTMCFQLLWVYRWMPETKGKVLD